MRIHQLLTAVSFSVLAATVTSARQAAPPRPAAAQPAAPVAAPKPAAPAAPTGAAPAPRPAAPRAASPVAAAAAARTAMLLTVTNPTGQTLPGVAVSLSGPLTREGTTDASGQLRFTGVRAGTYRARFSGEAVVTFEREVVVAAGRTADVDVSLNPAEPKPAPAPPPPPPPPPPPAPAPVGPAGQPRTASLVDLAEKELIGRNVPRRESLVACSGNTRSTLLQLNQEQTQRVYEGAESTLYVIAGEGTVKMAGRDLALSPGSLVSVPRGTGYALSRRGNRPLILLSLLSGEPCEEAQ